MPPLATFPAKDVKRDLASRVLKWKEWGNMQEDIKADFLESISITDCCLAWTCNNHLINKLSDMARWMNSEIPPFGFCPWCGCSINK